MVIIMRAFVCAYITLFINLCISAISTSCIKILTKKYHLYSAGNSAIYKSGILIPVRDKTVA